MVPNARPTESRSNKATRMGRICKKKKSSANSASQTVHSSSLTSVVRGKGRAPHLFLAVKSSSSGVVHAVSSWELIWRGERKRGEEVERRSGLFEEMLKVREGSVSLATVPSKDV